MKIISGVIAVVFLCLLQFEGTFAQSSTTREVVFDNCSEMVPQTDILDVTQALGKNAAYYMFKDHVYNKAYVQGKGLAIADYSQITDGKPLLTGFTDPWYLRVQRSNKAMYNNKIYFATAFRTGGIYVVDRITNEREVFDPLEGEGLEYRYQANNDVLVDEDNGLLYSSVYFTNEHPFVNSTKLPFYGLLEYNLNTKEKKWITGTSSPVKIPNALRDIWNIGKLFLDEVENVLYFSSGHGLWWWNRNTDEYGVYTSEGGIPVAEGYPQLPSDSTTYMYIDRSENKFYIGTYKGLYVWNRGNNTSTVINKENSILIDDLVNDITKIEDQNLILVSMEYGGLLEIDLASGKRHLYTKGQGNEINPQLPGNGVSSANYDPLEDKLYVSTWDGGVWIKDYQNLVPRPAVMVTSDATICEGASINLEVNSEMPLTVTWQEIDENGGEETIELSSIQVSPTATTTYKYTVATPSGCQADGEVTVTVGAPFAVAVPVPQPVCQGETITLEASEIEGATYTWEPGGATGRTLQVVVDEVKSYTVTAIDAQGCSSTASVTTPLKIDAYAGVDQEICITESALLSVTEGDSYLWSTGETTREIEFVPSSAGKHTLSVTVTKDGCSDTDEVVVTVQPGCPGEPLSFLARAVSTSQIDLHWIEPEGNHDQYVLVRRNASGTYETLATLPKGTINYHDQGLEPGTVYYYKLYAQVASLRSNEREAEARTFTPNQNYVMETAVLKEAVTDVIEVPDLDYTSRSSTWAYLNGLGTEIQSVEEGRSPSGKDIVNPIVFDALGLQSKQYLPYIVGQPEEPGNYRDKAEQEAINFYDNPPAGVASAKYPYAYIVFDQSPQNEVLQQFSPSEDDDSFAKGTTFENDVNALNEVPKWYYNPALGNVTATAYKAERLAKSTVINEDGETVVEFKDMLGRVVMSQVYLDNGETVTTTYVFDDKGRLLFLITPEVMKSLPAGYPKTIDNLTLREKCYTYTYDEEGHLIAEKSPDKEEVLYVYDPWDRIVLSQDGNQRKDHKWSFTKYDRYNRAVLTGLYDAGNAFDQAEMTGRVKDFYTQTEAVRYETYTAGGELHGYSNKSFPNLVAEGDCYNITYYDSYQILQDDNSFTEAFDFQPSTLCATALQGEYCFPDHYFNLLQGAVTVSKTKVVGEDKWLNSVIYYDERGRVIQGISQNHTGGTAMVSSVYNFVGWVLATYSTMEAPDGSTYGVKKKYVYDHAGRVMEGSHQVFKDGEPKGDEVLLAANVYNEIGQLIEKNLHVEAGVPLQSIDYRYNIRGWLKSINDPGLEEVPGVNEEDANLDMFGMDFFYNKQLMGVPSN